MAESVGEEIGKLRKEVNILKDETGGSGETPSIVYQAGNNVYPEQNTSVVSENDLDGSTLFWDDNNQGDWDDFYWAGDNDMDGYTSKTWIRVINKNNIFEDYFETNTFVDSTNSTGTGDYTTDYDYTLSDGDELWSKTIARNETTYKKAIIEIEGSNTSETTIYLSGDGGTNWEVVANGVEHTFTNTSIDGIKAKITNPIDSGMAFPLTFPETFPTAAEVTLTSYSVKYS